MGKMWNKMGRTKRLAHMRSNEQTDSFEERGRYFAERLVAWYQAGHRDLPWRRTKDPYHIWVSEVMLQQTRVDTVIPYYERFIARYPTVAALAEANEADLLKVWEGLGYYSRVRNMQLAARTVQREYGGVIPDTLEEIRKLKGIGPYTAGAVLSIAYGKPVPAVDGNVLRVISRYFLLYDDIAKPSARVKVEQLVESIIPRDAAGDFNQALMELGALICTPRSPECSVCPAQERCSALLAGEVEQLPVKSKAKKPRDEERAAYIIEGSGEREGQIMLVRRPDEGLLARMWELPNERMDFHMQRLMELDDRCFMEAEHVFSHIRWRMKVYRCAEHEIDKVLGRPLSALAGNERTEIAGEEAAVYEAGEKTENEPANEPVIARETGPADDSEHVIWVSRDTWRDVALPNVFVRILSRYFSSDSFS